MNITPPLFPADLLEVIREVDANPPAEGRALLTVEYKDFPGSGRIPAGESSTVSFYYEAYRTTLLFTAHERADESWWEVRLGYKTLASSNGEPDLTAILPEVNRLLALLKQDNEIQDELKSIRGQG